MQIECDATKAEENRRRRGVDFGEIMHEARPLYQEYVGSIQARRYRNKAQR